MNQDTICAIATAQGGALGIIRISGPEAITITDSIFTPANNTKNLLTQKPYTLIFGHIYIGEEVIDDVLISLFHAPHSYTGENLIEISCHGSTFILQQILQLLIGKGCRLAQPGEFTQRAFLNGKMDLSQAEAVADLIASTSEATHRLAMNQMRGGFSKELKELRSKLLNFSTLIELELDFSEEDVEFANRNELRLLTNNIEQIISRLVNSFSVGNAIKNGVPVAIIGETNSGKSTLLNALLNEEKAIVSDIHGTTRDVIEDTIIMGGVTFRFIDTAGIRDTTDTIENLGIERTFRKLDDAEIILWVIDSVNARNQIEKLKDKILPLTINKQLIFVINKSDLINTNDKNEYFSFLSNYLTNNDKFIFISAKQKINMDELEKLLIEAANIPTVTQNDIIVTNVRHYEALTKALESIRRVHQGLEAGISGDFLAQDIRECIYFLNTIVGELTTDDILINIFQNFCIGK